MEWLNREKIAEQQGTDIQNSQIFSGNITKTGSDMLCIEPKSYDDVQAIIDHLKTLQPAILNLSLIKKETAQRILDFLSGAIYALDGSICPIDKNGLFALTPKGSSISTNKF